MPAQKVLPHVGHENMHLMGKRKRNKPEAGSFKKAKHFVGCLLNVPATC